MERRKEGNQVEMIERFHQAAIYQRQAGASRAHNVTRLGWDISSPTQRDKSINDKYENSHISSFIIIIKNTVRKYF